MNNKCYQQIATEPTEIDCSNLLIYYAILSTPYFVMLGIIFVGIILCVIALDTTDKNRKKYHHRNNTNIHNNQVQELVDDNVRLQDALREKTSIINECKQEEQVLKYYIEQYKLTNLSLIAQRYDAIQTSNRLQYEIQTLQANQQSQQEYIYIDDSDEELKYFTIDGILQVGSIVNEISSNEYDVKLFELKSPYFIKNTIGTIHRINKDSFYDLKDISMNDLKTCKGFLDPITEEDYNTYLEEMLSKENLIYLLKLTLFDDTVIYKVGKTDTKLKKRIQRLRKEKFEKNIIYKSIIPLNIYKLKDAQNKILESTSITEGIHNTYSYIKSMINLSNLEKRFLDSFKNKYPHILDKEYFLGDQEHIIDHFNYLKNQ